MKRIIAEVYSADPDFDERPFTFYMEVFPAFVEKVVKLAKLVMDNHVYRVQEFYDVGTWSNEAAYDVMDTIIVADQDLDKDMSGNAMMQDSYYSDQVAKALVDSSARVDVVLLEVVKDAFSFTCYPKHGGGETKLSTQTIPISFLTGKTNTFLTDF